MIKEYKFHRNLNKWNKHRRRRRHGVTKLGAGAEDDGATDGDAKNDHVIDPVTV
jgi:hypothetical protein